MDAERASFVGRGGDDAAVARSAAHDHRFAAVLGVIALFDRGVERIEVAVEDRAALGDLDVHPMILAPCVFASSPMNRASASPSSIAAERTIPGLRPTRSFCGTASV